MIKALRESGRYNQTLLLVGMSLFCLSLSLFRCFFTETGFLLFLNWNLFLAFIPWAASSLIILNQNFRSNKIALLLLFGIWLLFFPNAPYILTDLFHLRFRGTMPVWFDLSIILAFAWTGLTFGFISLMDIESIVSEYINTKIARLISIVLLFVGSFGVYIGRYLRWNSWDIIQDPVPLLTDVADRFVNPLHHPRTWGMTILMGIILNMMFWAIRMISANRVLLSGK